MNLFVVKYTGPFGFIKPWTAVRDGGNPKDIHTFSQQFLTPSIVEGMEKKIFPELLEVNGIQRIQRHRLNYLGIVGQLERTWSKGGFKASKSGNNYKTNLAILNRGVMLEPHLYLAFESEQDAQKAMLEHICLCRNEDVMLPSELLIISESEFDGIDGFELLFDGDENTMFKVGHNRFNEASEMYGQLKVYGNPIRQRLI